MKIAQSLYENNGIDVCFDRELSDFEYGDAVMFLSEDSRKLHIFVDRLSENVCVWRDI